MRVTAWIGAGAALLAQPAGAAVAGPLAPSGKWQVDYSDIACTAKRQFGDYVLAFQPSPLGKTTRLVIQGPGKALSKGARQLPSIIDLGAGGTIKASSLIYPLSAKGQRAMQTFLPTDEFDRVLAHQRLAIAAGHKRDGKLIWDTNSTTRMGADLAIGPGAALSKALATCMDDLRKHWGLIDAEMTAPAIGAQAVGPIYSIFKTDDYPDEAMARGQTGTTRFLLLISEAGKVMDCVVVESSGVATLDAMGCQVIRERAKFTAAADQGGKPVKSTYVTPQVKWMIQ